MPGTALVTINENQWSVNVASTPTELSSGLSGVASIPAGTGMLFVLPARQLITVQTNEMLFALDIIFIKDDVVLDIARNISPGYLVEEATPIDMFLEVNVNEAALVEVGDAVSVEIITTQAPTFDFSSIIGFAIPLVVLGFVFGISGISGSGSSSNPKQLKGDNPMRWQSLSYLYSPGEKVDKVRDRLTGEMKTPVKFANTELSFLEGKCSHCNIALLLDNGHIVVDDCDEGKFNGMTFRNEREWRETILTKPEPSYPKEYYWEIFDIDTGEIIQKGKPYTTSGKALAAARSFQKGREPKEVEHLVVIRIFDTLNMEEWGKTIKPVSESGMRHGISTEISKTPLQKAALDRLWPYGIKEIHSDGDLTVFSSGKKWVVTTEGGVFREEDILHLGGGMIEIPISPHQKLTREPGPIFEDAEVVDVTDIENRDKFVWQIAPDKTSAFYFYTPYDAGASLAMAVAWRTKDIKDVSFKYHNSEVEVLPFYLSDKSMSMYWGDREAEFIDNLTDGDKKTFEAGFFTILRKFLSKGHSIHGEPRRRLVEQYGSWAVGRAEAICPEDDIACVTREAKRLIETIRGRYGEEAVKYVTIKEPGKTVFHSGDVVSEVAMERENKRVRELGEKEATHIA